MSDSSDVIDPLPHSRFYHGLYAAIEGLALWVVAIFLATYHATGSFLRSDMLTTIVEAMQAWRAAGALGLYELLGYAGLLLAVAGPLWLWAGKPLYEQYSGSARVARSTVTNLHDHAEPADWAPDGWESVVDVPRFNDEDQESDWDSTSEDTVANSDPIQAALADGDFLRGGSRDVEDTATRNSSGESSSS